MVDLGSAARFIGGISGPKKKDQADRVSLSVGGKIYEGWTEVKISRKLNGISGAFELALTDRWSDEQKPWIILPQDECKLKIGDDTVITGYIDDVDPSFDKAQRSIRVVGRDKAADLVDCSVMGKITEFHHLKLDQIAKRLIQPFGIPFKCDADVGAPFVVWKVNTGESVFETLERAAKLRSVMFSSDGAGGVVIAKVGRGEKTKAIQKKSSLFDMSVSLTTGSESDTGAIPQLIQGANLLSGGANYTGKDRFSIYQVKGDQSMGDEVDVTLLPKVMGQSKDPGVRRYRPYVIHAEANVDRKTAQRRAEWEAIVRAAKSARASVRVQGWRKADGALWKFNEKVHLKSRWLGIDTDLLVTGVTLSKSSAQGTITDLDLERADAYQPQPNMSDEGDLWRGLVASNSKK